MPQWRSRIQRGYSASNAPTEQAMVDVSSNQTGETAQSKRCSMAPVYVMGAYLAFAVFATVSDLSPEGQDFIKKTGGQLCWAYSSFELHRALILAQLAVETIVTIALWLLIRAGYCRLSLIAFGALVAWAVVTMFLPNECSI
jgi:hypothetical protein